MSEAMAEELQAQLSALKGHDKCPDKNLQLLLCAAWRFRRSNNVAWQSSKRRRDEDPGNNVVDWCSTKTAAQCATTLGPRLIAVILAFLDSISTRCEAVDEQVIQELLKLPPDEFTLAAEKIREHGNHALGNAVPLMRMGEICEAYVTTLPGGRAFVWAFLLFETSGAVLDRTRIIAIAKNAAQVKACERRLRKWVELPPREQRPWRVFHEALGSRRTRNENVSLVDDKISSVARELTPERSRSGYAPQRPQERWLPDEPRRGWAIGPGAGTGDPRQLFDLIGGDRLSEEEKKAGAPGNAMVVGRSGTGKTTMALLRQLAAEVMRPAKAKKLQSIFLTASPILSQEVRRTYTTLRDLPQFRAKRQPAPAEDAGADSVSVAGGASQAPSSSAAAPASLGSWFVMDAASEASWAVLDAEVYALDSDWSEVSEDGNTPPAEEAQVPADDALTPPDAPLDPVPEAEEHDGAPPAGAELPASLALAAPTDFPLFLTVRQFLHMLDATLRRPFFQRGDDLRPVAVDTCMWQPEGGGSLLINDWHRFHADAPEGADDDLDLESRQVGSRTREQATGAFEITFDYFSDYVWPKLGSPEKRQAYDPSVIWAEIMGVIRGSGQALRNDSGALSQAEYLALGAKQTVIAPAERPMVFTWYREYTSLKNKLGVFDEADFVTHIYRQIRADGYVGTGLNAVTIDEVQDVSQAALRLILEVVDPGVGTVTFCGDSAQTISKGLAFRLCDLRSAFVEDEFPCKHEPVEVRPLTRNYRCSPPVQRLANCVLGKLKRFFPNSIDTLPSEIATGDEQGAGVIMADLKDLVPMMTQLGGEAANRPAFGASAVVLVREQADKAKLPEELAHCLRMTVWEAKGLEFDTVVLYDFMTAAKANWQDPSAWDSGNALLCGETKQLYVAITRARKWVVFCEKASQGVEKMFGEFVTKDTQAVVATDMSLEAWAAQGRKLLQMGFAEQAKLCFSMSKEPDMESIAEATMLATAAAKQKQGLKVAEDDETAVAEIRKQFLRAAELFKSAGRNVSSARCLFGAGDASGAAALFAEAQSWDEAARAYLASGDLPQAARAYEASGQWGKVVEIWDQAGEAQKVLHAAVHAMNLPNTRKAIVKAVSRLDRDEILSAVKLLGGDSAPDQAADFLAELGAYRAALVLQPNKASYFYRHYHVVQAPHALEGVGPRPGVAAPVRNLLAVLYGKLQESDFEPLPKADQQTVLAGAGLSAVQTAVGRLVVGTIPKVFPNTLEVGVGPAAPLAPILDFLSKKKVELPKDPLTALVVAARQVPLQKRLVASLVGKVTQPVWEESGPVCKPVVLPVDVVVTGVACVPATVGLQFAAVTRKLEVFVERWPKYRQAAAAVFYAQNGCYARATLEVCDLAGTKSTTAFPIKFLVDLLNWMTGPLVSNEVPGERLNEGGTYVLNSLGWDWPAAVREGGDKDAAEEALQMFLDTHEDKMLDDGDDEDDVKVDADLSWQLQSIQAQLLFAQGKSVASKWDSEEWTWVAPKPAKKTWDAVREARLHVLKSNVIRRTAGRRVARAVRRWHGRGDHSQWAAICNAARILRSLKLSPPSAAARLVETILADPEDCKAISAEARRLSSAEFALSRRQQHMDHQTHLDRTRVARARAEELRRRRGAKRQLLLQAKAEKLAGMRGPALRMLASGDY
mmetsp:Transcript_28564/g.68690  ORF Transcript_28564/g.68690 Transcript_28564/m.68690 type:complete len:1663 (+) Transcript_28564:34-5022(+)